MEFEERQKLTNRIITGFTPVIFHEEIYKIYDPTPSVEYEAGFYVDNFCKDALIYDVPTSEETDLIIKGRGLWNEALEKELKFLQEDHERLSKKLAGLEFKTKEKKYTEAIIKANKERVSELHKQKTCLNNNTIEYLLRIEKYKYVIFKNTLNSSDKSVWKKWDDFDNGADNNLVIKLIQTCFFSSAVMNEKVIRELARSDPWRLYWRTATKTGRLFDRASTEITDLQRSLVSWSMLYDNVYESSECPDDDVIKDDVLLDAWLEVQHDKRKKEKSGKRADSINVDSKYTDVGIVVDSPEDAKKVYELNSPEALAGIRKRQSEIQKKGIVAEQNLSDSQQRMRIQANQKFAQSHKEK